MRITYNLINSFSPCYEPEEIDINAEYSATIPEFINQYRNKVKDKNDVLWTLCRNEFMSDQDLRLFGIWCARKVQYLMKDERSIKALDVAEKYANGLATDEELNAAWDAASDAASDASDAACAATAARAAASDAASDAAWAASDAVRAAASNAAWAAAWAAGWAAAWNAARAAAWNAGWAAACAASDAARDAAWNAAMDAQINKLLEFFIAQENKLNFDWSK